LVPATLDLTTRGAEEALNGVIFRQTDAQPTGTGVIDSFVRVQGANAKATLEQGYNTDARPLELDENKSPQFTRSLKLGDVPLANIDGVAYREFLLDINQKSSQPLLSLDELRLYVGNAPNLKGYVAGTRQLALLDPVYDLDPNAEDNWIKLDYSLNHGSGSGDLLVYVPNSVFADADANSYVYLYSKFGQNLGANAGFEEWAVIKSNQGLALGSLSGFVYQDINNDGIFDADELPIAGAIITLTGTDFDGNEVSFTTRTDVYGFYSFTGLFAGTYTITETQPDGYTDGLDSIGTLGGNDDISDIFSGIILGNGQDGFCYNFGELIIGNS
jgi:hypothetical protein